MSRRKRSREKSPTTGQIKQNRKSAKSTLWFGGKFTAEKSPGRERFLTHALPLIILILVASLAYVNAWPNNLTWDDAIFGMGNRLSETGFANFANYFTDDVWAAIGASTGIYRPLLLVSVALDIQVFGDWVAGFHLVNIFLHVLVTLTVYGLIRYLLPACGYEPAKSGLIALLAAMVFAVHPIHTEVVNSIFNRSEMLVSLGVVGGLWWFLPTVVNHPWRAWGLLGLVYLLAMLCRETGIMLPAIVVVFLWITTPGNWRRRLRKCLPVFWLLVPLAIYLGMRAHALDAPLTFNEVAANTPPLAQAIDGTGPEVLTRREGPPKLPVLGLFFNPGKTLMAVTVWFDSIRLMLWPHPLNTFHSVSKTNQWLALAAQLTLLGFAVLWLMQKRPGLLLGLAFFYLSILPASRIVGELNIPPHLAERYLYMPSVGITIVLALCLGWLLQRIALKTTLIPVLLTLMLLTPLTWARNAQWASTTRLAEADYRNNLQSPRLLQTLISSLLMKGDLARASVLCDQNADKVQKYWFLAGYCGQVYASLRYFDKAEPAFINATNNKEGAAAAHYGLAVMYLRQDRRDEAVEQFDLAVATEKQVFMQEYLSAEKLMRLYPSDPDRLLEARNHMEKCIELQPQYYHGRQRLEELNAMINSAGKSVSE